MCLAKRSGLWNLFVSPFNLSSSSSSFRCLSHFQMFPFRFQFAFITCYEIRTNREKKDKKCSWMHQNGMFFRLFFSDSKKKIHFNCHLPIHQQFWFNQRLYNYEAHWNVHWIEIMKKRRRGGRVFSLSTLTRSSDYSFSSAWLLREQTVFICCCFFLA